MLLISKIQTFIKSLIWHAYSGFPKSSQELINERLSICQKCDMFDNISSQCLVCGCNISNKKIFMNKLAWKGQKCPQNKW
jgi:hypothetical protein